MESTRSHNHRHPPDTTPPDPTPGSLDGDITARYRAILAAATTRTGPRAVAIFGSSGRGGQGVVFFARREGADVVRPPDRG